MDTADTWVNGPIAGTDGRLYFFVTAEMNRHRGQFDGMTRSQVLQRFIDGEYMAPMSSWPENMRHALTELRSGSTYTNGFKVLLFFLTNGLTPGFFWAVLNALAPTDQHGVKERIRSLNKHLQVLYTQPHRFVSFDLNRNRSVNVRTGELAAARTESTKTIPVSAFPDYNPSHSYVNADHKGAERRLRQARAAEAKEKFRADQKRLNKERRLMQAHELQVKFHMKASEARAVQEAQAKQVAVARALRSSPNVSRDSLREILDVVAHTSMSTSLTPPSKRARTEFTMGEEQDQSMVDQAVSRSRRGLDRVRMWPKQQYYTPLTPAQVAQELLDPDISIHIVEEGGHEGGRVNPRVTAGDFLPGSFAAMSTPNAVPPPHPMLHTPLRPSTARQAWGDDSFQGSAQGGGPFIPARSSPVRSVARNQVAPINFDESELLSDQSMISRTGLSSISDGEAARIRAAMEESFEEEPVMVTRTISPATKARYEREAAERETQSRNLAAMHDHEEWFASQLADARRRGDHRFADRLEEDEMHVLGHPDLFPDDPRHLAYSRLGDVHPESRQARRRFMELFNKRTAAEQAAGYAPSTGPSPRRGASRTRDLMKGAKWFDE